MSFPFTPRSRRWHLEWIRASCFLNRSTWFQNFVLLRVPSEGSPGGVGAGTGLCRWAGDRSTSPGPRPPRAVASPLQSSRCSAARGPSHFIQCPTAVLKGSGCFQLSVLSTGLFKMSVIDVFFWFRSFNVLLVFRMISVMFIMTLSFICLWFKCTSKKKGSLWSPSSKLNSIIEEVKFSSKKSNFMWCLYF